MIARQEHKADWRRVAEKRLFYLWAEQLVESMTLVDVLPEGKLYYFASSLDADVWVVAGERRVIVAYHCCESPSEIRENVRIWYDALKAYVESAANAELDPLRDLPPRASASVFGAEVNPADGNVIVAWFQPGDWFGLTFTHLPKEWSLLPMGWPESYRSRIAELAETRVRNPASHWPA